MIDLFTPINLRHISWHYNQKEINKVNGNAYDNFNDAAGCGRVRAVLQIGKLF